LKSATSGDTGKWFYVGLRVQSIYYTHQLKLKSSFIAFFARTFSLVFYIALQTSAETFCMNIYLYTTLNSYFKKV